MSPLLLPLVLLLLLLPAGPLSAAPEADTRLASVTFPEEPDILPPSWIRVLEGEEPVTIILIEKQKQLLEVLRFDGSLRSLASYPCATGQNRGRKEKAGDEKTPEGIYFITKTYTDRKITIFGRRAFHLDYPNYFDVRENRNGDGIYIHGTNRDLTPHSTNGCISMRNDDLDVLVRHLRRQQTPVVIVENRKQLRRASAALSGLDTDRLRQMLLPVDPDGDPPEFASLVLISDGRQTVAQGRFRNRPDAGGDQPRIVRGYLAYDNDGGWQLSKLRWLPEPEQPQPTIARPRLARVDTRRRPVAPVFDYPQNEKEVLAFVENWRRAWQTKQLDQYISCYAPDFSQSGKDLDAWRRYKAGLNKRYRTISVTIDNVRVDWTRNGARVLFHQVYQSDKYHADGRKLLYLSYGDSGWRITREIWLN